MTASTLTPAMTMPATSGSHLGTLDRFQPILVELDTESRLVGHVQVALFVQQQWLREHEVALGFRPVRRIVGVFDERAVGNGCRDVQIGGEAESVRPRMRRKQQSL